MVNFAVIGLGNPGPNYRNTRHNLGFWMLDALAEENRLQFKENKNYHSHYTIMAHGDKKILLVKPTTFMNDSGNYLSSLLSYFSCCAKDVILVHDELTLPFGDLKISNNRGSGGHNGVESVISHIGNTFTRFRIGIGAKPFPHMKLSEFVLSKLSQSERILIQTHKERFIKAFFSIIDNGLSATMNSINQTQRSQQPQ